MNIELFHHDGAMLGGEGRSELVEGVAADVHRTSMGSP
jgi:hypothetical protein